MGNEQIRVIHLDSEKGWRGGQQQVVYLVSNLVKQEIPSLLICQPVSRLQIYCREKNLPYRSVPMKGELDLISAQKIAIIARKRKYNIIHAHSAHALATALWVKIFYPNVKVVGTRRVDFQPRRNIFSRIKYGASLLDKIVCISKEIEKILHGYGVSSKKLKTIYSGIDVRKFDAVDPMAHFREMYNIPADHVVVGTVAALVGHKDYPNLLKAAKYVTERMNSVTFVALGTGPDEKKIRGIRDQLELKNRFILAGFQENVGAFLKNFNIYIQASKKEGLGTSILDAFAAGLPIIGTKAGGIPELIRDQSNGILVEASDHVKLGDAIISLINDPELRAKLSNNAIEFVKRFDVDKTVNQYIELYWELLR